jgi:hypothetical protein
MMDGSRTAKIVPAFGWLSALTASVAPAPALTAVLVMNDVDFTGMGNTTVALTYRHNARVKRSMLLTLLTLDAIAAREAAPPMWKVRISAVCRARRSTKGNDTDALMLIEARHDSKSRP